MSTPIRLLLLEDEPNDAELAIAILEEAGFACQWDRTDSKEGFLELLGAQPFDLILADHALPNFDGLSALKLVQDHKIDVPVILVSGVLGEEAAIASLKAGAADYVLKSGLSRLPVAVKGALGETEDRRKRREAEESLAESEKRLRTVFEAADNVAFVTTDLAGSETRILGFSPGAEKIFGYSSQEVIGERVSILLVPGALPDFQEIQTALRAGKKGHSGESWMIRKSGEEFPGLFTLHPVLDSTGNVVGAVGVTIDITNRKRAEEELLESRDQLRDLTTRLDEVREEERKAVARELHDDVGQPLTAMLWDLDQLEGQLRPEQKDLAGRIRSMIQLTGLAVERVNLVSRRIRSPELELLGLEEAIGAHAADLQDRSGVRMEVSTDQTRLVPQLERDFTIFRVVQEALSNVVRHSQASTASIRLVAAPEELILEIRDDGIGITEAEKNHPSSYGIIGMRERLERLGGTLEIFPTSPGGTTVRSVIPTPSDTP